MRPSEAEITICCINYYHYYTGNHYVNDMYGV